MHSDSRYAIRDILQSSPEVRDRLTTNRSAPFLSTDRGALPAGPGGITPTSHQLRKRAAREAREAKRTAKKQPVQKKLTFRKHHHVLMREFVT